MVILQIIFPADVKPHRKTFCCGQKTPKFDRNNFWHYIKTMKLYSAKQVFIRASLTGLVAIFLTASVFLFVGRKTKNQNNLVSSATQEQNDFALEIAPNEIQSIQVAGTSNSYTQDEAQNIAVYENCNEAVVNITTQVMGYNWFLEPVVTSSGSGSGSIIDKRGYVVTNVHVIADASTITISLADGSSYEGRVVGKDSASDIAVLKFEPASGVELKTISFGDSENLKVGQKVIAIGNPFALERTMTAGIISGLGRPIQESENVIIRNMIQTDAAINPGNSGGPLLDSQGRMIGINTIIYSSSGSSSGVGFAVPVSTARRVVNDLIQFGKVNRGIMNLSLVQNTSRIASYAGYNIRTGMIVSRVKQGSLAEKAGVKGGTQAVQYGTFNPKTIYLGGDIITQINGLAVNTLADYYAALEDKKPGDTITLTVYRNKKYVQLSVTLEGEGGTNL